MENERCEQTAAGARVAQGRGVRSDGPDGQREAKGGALTRDGAGAVVSAHKLRAAVERLAVPLRAVQDVRLNSAGVGCMRVRSCQFEVELNVGLK